MSKEILRDTQRTEPVQHETNLQVAVCAFAEAFSKLCMHGISTKTKTDLKIRISFADSLQSFTKWNNSWDSPQNFVRLTHLGVRSKQLFPSTKSNVFQIGQFIPIRSARCIKRAKAHRPRDAPAADRAQTSYLLLIFHGICLMKWRQNN